MIVHVTRENLNKAAAILLSGGIVAYPTETYYGLAVNPFDDRALEKLYRVKQRSQKKPFLVLIADREQLDNLVLPVPAVFEQLITRFWPGPLTLVCQARKDIPLLLTGESGTVGCRLSPHKVAGQLLDVYGGPITATSANISGQAAAVCADQVQQVFGESIDLILDGGATPGEKGSTLIGVRDGQVYLLRDGAIAFTDIVKFLASD